MESSKPQPPAAEALADELTERLSPHPSAGLVPAPQPDEYRLLRADIELRGIVTPLEVTPDLVVVDGHQRLRIAHDLEFARIPVRVVRPDDEIRYMVLAALRRRHLNASQRAALALELDDYELRQIEARARQRANLRNAVEVATLPPRGERTREIAARLAGVSPRTVQDAATVRAHDPALFEQVKNGGIPAERAARRVRRIRRDAEIGPPPPLPQGPFELIYADPPWQLGNPDGEKAPEKHYSTMPFADIAALHLPAAADAILYVSAVNMLLPEALQLIDAWGFRYVGNIAWVKPSIGLGNWVRYRHELLLIGQRGAFSPPDSDLRPDSVIEAPRGRHSQKPARMFELIERAYPAASKLELFARNARPGWTAWGNEAPR